MSRFTPMVLLALGVILINAAGALAHGGGLDSSNCHLDRSTGEKHCHGIQRAGVEAATPAQRYTGRPSIVDGDTLEIHGQRFRLHGIDAPESSQTCTDGKGRAYRCGQKAGMALASLVGQRVVTCTQTDYDSRFRRIVAVCRLGDLDLNGWMVLQGLALAYVQYSSDYVAAEAEARTARRGIWAGTFDAPWDWRRQH